MGGNVWVRRRLRVGIVAPPLLPVPPPRYGGTERIVHALAEGLHARGHAVTVLASGDSTLSCEIVPTVPRAGWLDGITDVEAAFDRVLEIAWREHDRFDIVHLNLDVRGFRFAQSCPTPAVTTFHGRVDSAATVAKLREHPGAPLVAISRSQQSLAPWANWVGMVHNGLDLTHVPFRQTAGDYLLFVGRIASEKGIVEAIDVATRAQRRLLIAAKIVDDGERDLFARAVQPYLRPGRVDFLGEVGPPERDQLFANACATLMLGDWPEPFGLVAIESLAAGTPVIARRRGALPEIIENGADGFLVEDPLDAVPAAQIVQYLDRTLIRQRVLLRFSASRMIDGYESLFARMLGREVREAEPFGESPVALAS